MRWKAACGTQEVLKGPRKFTTNRFKDTPRVQSELLEAQTMKNSMQKTPSGMNVENGASKFCRSGPIALNIPDKCCGLREDAD